MSARQLRRTPHLLRRAIYVPGGPRHQAGGGLVEEGEDIEVIETTVEAALALVDSGEIIDVKTILLLHYARSTGLMQA